MPRQNSGPVIQLSLTPLVRGRPAYPRPAYTPRLGARRTKNRLMQRLFLRQHLTKLAPLRDKAEQLGKFGDAISAEVSRGRALGYHIDRRESGAAGAFQAKMREEAHKQLEETIVKIAAKQALERAAQTAKDADKS